MGCDIHLFAEYKSGDGPWTADRAHKIVAEDDSTYKYLKQLRFSARNYELFAALAGVRGPGPDPKGLPEDCSSVIRNGTTTENYGDDHSHSYTNFEEFVDILKSCNIKTDGVFEFLDSESDIEYGKRWAALCHYIRQEIDALQVELEIEKHLLGQNVNTEVQARLVYWFDN